MFDTHCHLNFQAFDKNVEEVVSYAVSKGINFFVIPGTDFETSQKAVKIAGRFENIFAAVGIHPHHAFKLKGADEELIKEEVKKIALLSADKNVVAIGEVGVDRHVYKKTKYENYKIDEKFIDLQKKLLKSQIKTALEQNKSLILHNRQAKSDLLQILEEVWDDKLVGKTVFHCCEPDPDLLDFAKQKKIFLGFDGDLTYNPEKQIFIKKIPLDLLVFETDSPFLTPEPIRSKKRFPNEPANLVYILEMASYLLKIPFEKLKEISLENSLKLFGLI